MEKTHARSTLDDKINILVDHKTTWVDKFTSSTGDEVWDKQQNELIQEWDATRKTWISYVAHNDHAFSRDLVKPYLRQIDESGLSNRSAHSAQKRFLLFFGTDLKSLIGLSSREEFEELFTKMKSLIFRAYRMS